MDLNSDVSINPDTARALHRVVRAIHDGNCPNCGHLDHVDEFRVNASFVADPEPYGTFIRYECPECRFAISPQEASAAMEAFRPFMKANVQLFEEWRKRRG